MAYNHSYGYVIKWICGYVVAITVVTTHGPPGPATRVRGCGSACSACTTHGSLPTCNPGGFTPGHSGGGSSSAFLYVVHTVASVYIQLVTGSDYRPYIWFLYYF